MLVFIAQVAWLLLPAACANMAPVLFSWLPLFNAPVDGGATLCGRRLFGSHKTWRGLFFGVLVAIGVVSVQQRIVAWTGWETFIEYGREDVVALGLAFGVGALGGDLLKSFFKRRLSIAPGYDWFIFDQVDWIVGALLATSFLYPWSSRVWLCALLLFGLAHVLVNRFGRHIGIRK